MRRFQVNRVLSLSCFFLLPALLAVIEVSLAFAQAPFYQGKTITLIVGAGPGGMGDVRAKAIASSLPKHIPGNPNILFQYAGRRRSKGGQSSLHQRSPRRPHLIPYLEQHRGLRRPRRVRGQYDIDKLIYLGTTEHLLYYLFNTRAEAGLNTLAKLRAAAGVERRSQQV